jgi:hypothetical protein
VASPCEADIRAFYHADKIKDTFHSDAPVVFDFEDTDVWMVGAYISQFTDESMYMYTKRSSDVPSFSICKSFFSDRVTASAALGIYVFTGVDTVSAFFGCGKVAAFKRMINSKEKRFVDIMDKLGSTSSLTNELLLQLELFTIRIIYNDPISNTLSAARARKWRQSTKDDSARLPPDKDSFKQHCLRAHLQVRNCLTSSLWHLRANVLQIIILINKLMLHVFPTTVV